MDAPGYKREYNYGNLEENNDYVGGLIGGERINIESSKSITTNSYYDSVTTGQSESDGGVGKTTTEMKDKSTYEGWDFDTIWTMDSGYLTLK